MAYIECRIEEIQAQVDQLSRRTATLSLDAVERQPESGAMPSAVAFLMQKLAEIEARVRAIESKQ